MAEHLTEEQWSAVALSSADDAVCAHIDNCGQCRAEGRELQAAILAVRRSALAAAERPEAFWQRQRALISARVSLQRFVERRLVWAMALAVVALAATTLLRQAPPRIAATDPDQALLMDVERSVDSGVPEALAPAALLTQEISQAAQTTSDSKSSQSRKREHQP